MLVRILDLRDVDRDIAGPVLDAEDRGVAPDLQKVGRLLQRRQQRPLLLRGDETMAAPDRDDAGLPRLPQGGVPGLVLPASHEEHPAPEAVGECVKRAAEYAEEQGGDFNLITSSGSAATQTIQHVHVHYVPRRDDDGLTLPWTGQGLQRSTALGLEGADDD